MKKRKQHLRRVLLAVPGSDLQKIEKAALSAADHVFCDLEDAVAPEKKEEARVIVCDALTQLDWGKKARCVRVNGLSTRWFREDMEIILEKAGGDLDTIMLTKSRTLEDVLRADRLLTELEESCKLNHRIGLELLIEEVQALQNIDQLASCCERVESLIFGSEDYAASQGMWADDYQGDIFYYPRFRITMAARAAMIDAIDSPFVNFKDEAAYRAECQQARALGMTGKMAIHPSQIDLALEIFTPSQAAIDHARAMVKAYGEAQAKGIGAIQIDGVMLDAANIRFHQNILDKAGLLGL